MREHFDVLVVGAGISGIGAAYHLQTRCPHRSFVILEARDALGGTWDLFRYPGIRSDSDMYTLGFSFRPWTDPKAIADGPSILRYLKETAEAYGIDRKVRHGHRVRRASWSTRSARWTVEAERTHTGETVALTCNFLFMCGGYYDYESGYTPDFPGVERFEGLVVHPQKWTPDIEHEDKRVVVIGSGATAVTLVPELAKRARHVTMLQRSPTYVVSRPDEDEIANALRRFLPQRLAYALTRWKNVLLGMLFFQYCRRHPDKAKAWMLDGVRQALGSEEDVRKHFTPRYDPWDQRVCLVPNGDLFEAIGSGRASVVTDRIDTFTERGIRLESGQELVADLVVTATGLNLQFLSNLDITVDGQPFRAPDALTYKAMMLSDLPNLAFSTGYTNASWTLKCDLTCDYVCRLLNYMARRGYTRVVPRLSDPSVSPEPIFDFTSGYVQRKIHEFPKRGSKAPWRLHQNYFRDLATVRLGPLVDDALELS